MSDSENSAPEELTFAKAKEKIEIHDKVLKSQKMKKKRQRLNTNLLKIIAEEEKPKPESKNVIKKTEKVVETIIPEVPEREIPDFKVSVKILKESKPLIDPEITDWLREHFYGSRVPRQESHQWYSNKLKEPTPDLKFLRTTHQ